MIGVDSDFFFFIFYGFVALFIGFLCVLIGWVIHWSVLTPKDARELKKAKSKRWPLNTIFFDEGFAEIAASKKFTEEIVQNPDDSFGALPSRPTIVVDQNAAKTLNDGGQPIITVDEQVTTQNAVNKMGTHRFYLRSVGVPVWIQIAPKGIAMNTKTLALIQKGGEESPIKDLQLNPLLIKEYFGRMWLTNRLKSIARRSEEIGWRKTHALIGKWEKWIPLSIILALSAPILVLALVFAKFI